MRTRAKRKERRRKEVAWNDKCTSLSISCWNRKPLLERALGAGLGRLNVVRGKDQIGLDELFVAHMPHLYHATAQVLRHPQDSEDALQDGLLAAFRHLNQFQDRAKFSIGLHRIVVNAALAKLRHRKHELTIASTDEGFEDGDLNPEVRFPDQRPTRRRILGPRPLPNASRRDWRIAGVLSSCHPDVRR